MIEIREKHAKYADGYFPAREDVRQLLRGMAS